MQTISHSIGYPSRLSTFRLWHLTDLHLGAAACDEKLLKKHIAQIADDPNARWLGGGDYIECIARKGDKRFQEETLADWLHGKDDPIELQIERTTELLEPIADKCLGLAQGNHEWAALTHSDRDVYRSIVTRIAKMAKRDPASLALGAQGFGVPIVEAQAAGCPVIVTDFTAMSELCFGGHLIPVGDDDLVYTLQGSEQANVGASKIVAGLEWAYEQRGNLALRAQARDGAMNYDLKRVMQRYMLPALECMAEINRAEAVKS